MLLLLAKKLIPAPAAAGLVGMTVLLTNSRKNPPQASDWPLLTALDIDEKEMDPEVPQTPPSPPEIPEEGPKDDKSSEEEGSEEKDEAQSPQEKPEQSEETPPATPESQGQTESSPEIQHQPISSLFSTSFRAEPPDPESLPKIIMMEIAERQPVWVSTAPNLNSIYEMSTRIDGLLYALKRLQAKQK